MGHQTEHQITSVSIKTNNLKPTDQGPSSDGAVVFEKEKAKRKKIRLHRKVNTDMTEGRRKKERKTPLNTRGNFAMHNAHTHNASQ